VTELEIPEEQRDDAAVAPLECDERAGVEREPWHVDLVRRGRCLTAARAPGCAHAQRAIGITTFLRGHGASGFLEHLLEQAGQVVELDLLCERRGHVGTDAGGAALAHGPPGAFGQAAGQTHRDLLGHGHTSSMTASGRESNGFQSPFRSPEMALGERSPRARLQVLLELRCARLVRQLDGGDELPGAQRRRVHGPATIVRVQPLLHVACNARVVPRRRRHAAEDVDDRPVAHHDASGCKVSATDSRVPDMGLTGRGGRLCNSGREWTWQKLGPAFA